MLMYTESDAEFYGVREGVDSTEALQTALNETASKGIELNLPPFDVLVSKPLTCAYDHVMIKGRGRRSKIKTTDTGFDVLTIGTGALPNLQGNHRGGYVKHFTIEGSVKSPKDMSVGLKLENIRFVRVEGIESNGFNFGFDLNRNCFGTSYHDIRTHFGDNCFAIRLRGLQDGVWGSGSDIPFFNAWLGGSEGAVWVDPGGGGYSFTGGQLSMGYDLKEDRDDLGCIVMGKNYETGEIGGSGLVSISAMDVEGWKRAYAVRGYGRCHFESSRVSYIATDKVNQALGILKVTDGENGVFGFEYAAPKGTYSKADLIDISANGSAFTYHEHGTLPDYNLYAAGVQVKAGVMMAQQSRISQAVYSGRQGGKPFIGMGGTQIRPSATGIEISQDFGKTFK